MKIRFSETAQCEVVPHSFLHLSSCRCSLVLLAFFIPLLSAADLEGQMCLNWGGGQPAPPQARGHHAMVYHPSNGIVLFGGIVAGQDGNPDILLGDTWLGWIESGVPGPSARFGHVMAYDGCHDAIVLFGGSDDRAQRNDTWAWDGASWEMLQDNDPGATDRPSARAHAAMAYDLDREKIVLFGGSNAVGYFGDTWEWNWETLTWTNVCDPADPKNCSGAPSGREGHGMAYHPANGLLMFGGGAGTPKNETWAWDGSLWTQLTDEDPPGFQPTPSRYWTSLVYDCIRRRVWLFGGGDAINSYNDFWCWDGFTWELVIPDGEAESPPRRSRYAMGFHPEFGRIAVFGGFADASNQFDDTWGILTRYGDNTCNGIVDLDCFLCAIAGFGNAEDCPAGDIAPCGGDGIIDLDDILGVVAGFSGLNPCCSE